MQYSKQVCFDEVKGIISDMFTYISNDKITPDAKMKKGLGFDIIDRINIITEFEYKYNVSIKADKALMTAVTLGEFCDILHKEKSANDTQIIVADKPKNTFLYRVKNLFTRQN